MAPSMKRKAAFDSQRVTTKLKKSMLNGTHTPKVTNTSVKPVSTRNRYADLTDNENEVAANMPKPPKIKIPPIVVINASYAEINDLMNKINVKNYNLKNMSMGIKVLCNTLDDYYASVGGLKEAKAEFHSHGITSQQPMKFVLGGLPELSVDEVKSGLQSANVSFIDVKKMRTKSDNKNYALYLVYFANKTVKLSELKATKFILNVVISWSPYVASKKGPTQCNNCQLHGYGSRNCNLPPRCSKCGGKHASSDCLRYQFPLPEQPFICCLCGNAHSSRDRNCPKRTDYIKMKLSRSSNMQHPPNNPNQTNGHSHQRTSQKPPFIRNDSEFPALSVQQGRKYADWFLPNQSSPAVSSNMSTSEELFSPQQLLDLTTELISNLRSCRSKLDQFQVITKLAIKYVNYD